MTDYCEVTVTYRDASGADLGYAPQLAITTPASTPMRFLGRFTSLGALQTYAAAADNVGACALVGTALYHSTGILWATPSGGGGGGASYPEVLTFGALPTGQSEGATYIVLQASGVPFINRRAAGMYRFTSGQWAYLGEVPDGYFADNVLRFFDNADPTKQLALELSGISGGTLRTLTVPDASGTVALTNDPRFTDTREPSTATVTQLDAEAGTGTPRVMWTVQRVWQAITKALGGVVVTNTPTSGQVLKATSTTTAAWGTDNVGVGTGGSPAALSYVPATNQGTVTDTTSGTSAVIPLPTAGQAGLMTHAESIKLAGVETWATANATNAQLRDRTTHTGKQAISTVTGLQTELDAKMPTGTMVDVTASVTIVPNMNGFRFKTTAFQQFTVPSGLGGAFVGVTVRGPCTWVAQGTTVTDRRQTGQSFDFCQLIQVAANDFVLVGTTA